MSQLVFLRKMAVVSFLLLASSSYTSEQAAREVVDHSFLLIRNLIQAFDDQEIESKLWNGFRADFLNEENTSQNIAAALSESMSDINSLHINNNRKKNIVTLVNQLHKALRRQITFYGRHVHLQYIIGEQTAVWFDHLDRHYTERSE